ncbi:MAG: hypothetical protein WCV67_20570 [Victivallaceae bacterium]
MRISIGRILLIMFPAIVMTGVLCSCLSSKSENKRSPLPPITVNMKTKAAELKKILFPGCREFGVFITYNTIELYDQEPEALGERLALLGVTDVYFDFDIKLLKQADFTKKLHGIVNELRRRGIRCSPVIEDEPLYQPNHSRNGTAAIEKVVGEIKSFNRRASDQQEFTGITPVISPHRVSSSNINIKNGMIYSWSENTYGKNGENDMIMKQSLNILEDIKKEAAPLPLSIIIEHYYHGRAVKGDLSCGTINDFLKYGDHVILTSYAKYSNEIKGLVLNQLKDCNKADSVVLCLRTARTIYGDDSESVSFTRKKWKQFISDLSALVQTTSKYKSFHGIAFREFEGLELQWEKVE